MNATNETSGAPAPEVTNRERFRAIYEAKLTEAVTRDKSPPHTGLPLYAYGVAEVPGVVAKMIPALALGQANVGGVVKATARALGIKPTMGAIRAYLNGAAPLACMACEIATKQRKARGIRETPSIDECPVHGEARP